VSADRWHNEDEYEDEFDEIDDVSIELCSVRQQWRRQIIKSGSAFKGQLYLQVGQMEGPKVSHNFTSEAPETRSAGALRGWVLGSSGVASTH